MDKKLNRRRTLTATVLILVCLCAYAVRLVKVQIIDAEKYSSQRNSVSVSRTVVTAARGEILDRNGNALIYNRQGNSIVFNFAKFPSYRDQQARNTLIYSLIHAFDAAQEEWTDYLPLEFDESGAVIFSSEREADIKYLKSKDMLGLNDYATAQNCFDALVERYALEEYSAQDARDIASVCYNMKRLVFSSSSPYVFAKDVSQRLVSVVKENADTYPGVDVEIVSYREYSDGTLAEHILGMTGAINAEEYEAKKLQLDEQLKDTTLSEDAVKSLKTNAYTLNDTIGKSGLELALEQQLRGQNGIKATAVDSLKNISQSYEVLPVQGNTVVTTIHSGLQAECARLLEKSLEELKLNHKLDSAGAAVVIDVNTGEILACVSVPGYDISTYSENYTALAADTSAPLWNRALMSAYAPGSTIKPAMGIAGLETGVITADEKIFCNSSYNCRGATFKCLDSHGNLNVSSAITKSCNVFFYETGTRLGITQMNKYCSMFGLGSKTGVELPETEGILAGEAYRASVGGVWNLGDTVQAAIGQSDNLFSPMQLACYASMLATGGTRYQPHFVKSVIASDTSEVIYETPVTVASQSVFAPQNLAAVRKGMYDLASTGSCAYAFKNCVVDAAIKTGTSQVVHIVNGERITGNNGFIISYAPFNNPQIAVAVAAENVERGSGIAAIASGIYDYYFTQVTDYEKITQGGTLLF
ncbi:MAG: hypothetical protein GX051_08365 [Clostridiales bacterium]|nr:hypothetical protein [Clostridiales bacterium]